MKITIEGTPEEIAAWARQVAGVTNVVSAPCPLPHYAPLTPAYPPWPWDGATYTVPTGTVTELRVSS